MSCSYFIRGRWRLLCKDDKYYFGNRIHLTPVSKETADILKEWFTRRG